MYIPLLPHRVQLENSHSFTPGFMPKDLKILKILLANMIVFNIEFNFLHRTEEKIIK